MSSRRPWYKRFPADFIAGTMRLTLEEKGAYSVVLDLLYDHGGPIADDSQWLARVCGCSTRKWNLIRQKLLAEGKIYLTDDGRISNRRVDRQAPAEALEAKKLAENGAKSARKSHENAGNSEDKTAENEPTSHENKELAEKGLPGGQEHIYIPDAICQKDDDERPSVLDTGRAFLHAIGQDHGTYEAVGKSYATVGLWLSKGATHDEVVEIGRRLAGTLIGKKDPVAYLNKFWSEKLAELRQQAEAEAQASQHNPEAAAWRMKLLGYREKGLWLPMWGPKPGEPGCFVPAALLAEHTAKMEGTP